MSRWCTHVMRSDDGLTWCTRCGYEPSASQEQPAPIPEIDIVEIHEEQKSIRDAERLAARRAQVARRRTKPITNHGKSWSYTLGCRCDLCKQAYQDSRARRKDAVA